MGQTHAAVTPFAEWLRAQLDERQWGVRTLARRMNPAEPEVARRAVNRYLRGSLPTAPNRQAIADALGVPLSSLPQEAAPSGVTFRGPRPGAARGGAPDGQAGARGGDS